MVNPNFEAIGKRVKLLRIEDDPYQTQAQFASKLGTSGPTVSKIERGKSEPSATFLLRLSEMSGKSVDWILKGDKGKAGEGGNV